MPSVIRPARWSLQRRLVLGILVLLAVVSVIVGGASALDGTVTLSRGEMPASDYCWEMTTDALIHSWDLARGIGADDTLDAELVDLVYERTLPFVDELQKTGMFAPPVPVPDDAPPQTKLLAIFGRRA